MNTLCHDATRQAQRALDEPQFPIQLMPQPANPPPPLPGENAAIGSEELREILKISSSILCHDLGAPARAIEAFAEALIEDCGQQLTPNDQDYLRRIAAAAQRLNGMIRDLTVYKRLHLHELAARKVCLEYVIMEALAQATSNIRAEVVPPLPEVRSDERLLFQSIRNLCAFALKFAVQPPSKIRALSHRHGEFVRIILEFSGAEIDRRICEKLQRILKPDAAAEEVISLGLELAILRQSTRMLQARVGADVSEPCQPRCWIDLPQ